MEFVKLPLAGAFLVKLDPRSDHRGFFARTFCVDEFEAAGLPVSFPQQNMARSIHAGTLRGLHLQVEPDGEDKYVRCVTGRIFDAIVDLRAESPTYLQSCGVTLDALHGDALFVPKGFAHGYQTLVADTDVLYAMSARYAPASARNVRWNDPELKIDWPLANPILSDLDREAPGLDAILDELTLSRRAAI